MLLCHMRSVLLTLPGVWCDSKGVAIMLVKFLMDSNEAWKLKGLKGLFSMVVLHKTASGFNHRLFRNV